MILDAVTTELRARIDAFMAAEAPSVPYTIDNDPFDWQKPPAFFLAVQVQFSDGEQIRLGLQGMDRIFGAMLFGVRSKVGTGDGEATRLLDKVAAEFAGLRVSAPTFVLQGQAFRPVGTAAPGRTEWVKHDAVVAFYADPRP